MPIRYMGTKRSIAPRVRDLMIDLAPAGQILDLFSGIGCVAESLASVAPVQTNDALSFTAALARARFKGPRNLTSPTLIEKLRATYRPLAEHEAKESRDRLRDEQRAIDLGSEALNAYMNEVQHVGNSAEIQGEAALAAQASGPRHYRLTRCYFGGGYFSMRQALHLDAIRYAIDMADLSNGDRDWAIAAWISTAAKLVNAPGHTAQYLRPNSLAAYKRLRQCWTRNTWDIYQNEAITLQLVGQPDWRRLNKVHVSDALELLRSNKISEVGAVYADPPYTKDQYSRYYHVYETMYRYDYPSANGAGRVRADRFVSAFCLKTEVARSFDALFAATASLGLPLVLSYPSDGLLAHAGETVDSIGSKYMNLETVKSFSANHSTMGASKGATTKSATENIYVYIPK